MNESITDEALLVAIGDKDEAAMKQLYLRHADAIYRFALKILCNPGDAAEVVNEVLMQVWDRPAAFSGGSKVKTWLLGITQHKAVDAVRRGRRHHENHVSDEWIDLDPAVEPACLLTQGQMNLDNRRFVRQCMETLAEIHRHVVHLTFFEELSYPEIAGVLGIPSGTVKTRMMHAKNLLMNCLHRVTRGELAEG
jgi:RNA polymerase sigma-70 factor (ECF subfamily)